MPKGPTFALAAAFAAAAARADAPQPLGVPDLLGARALSLSAFRGVAPGNDGIFYNPAGLAARRRYAAEVQYLIERIGDSTAAQFIGGSVVDSQTSSTTGGVAWTRIASGPYLGSVTHLALAMPLAPGVFVGASGKYLSLDGPAGDEIRAATADAGFFWALRETLTFSATGYNLIPAGHRSQMPRGLGAGVAVGTDRSFHVTADWRADFDRHPTTTHSYGAGFEVLVADTVPLRAGILKDETLGGEWWSVGAGLVSASGIALDLSYRQAFGFPSDRAIAAALKIFFTSQ